MKTCPKCLKNIEATLLDCPSCGIIFSKWETAKGRASMKDEPLLASTPTESHRSRWILSSAIFVSILLYFWANNKVKEKTKGASAKDAVQTANRIALKATGLDSKFYFLNFVKDGDVESVAKYLSAGYSPDTRAGEGSALGIAITLEKTEMFDLLIQHGANVNVNDRDGKSLLWNAAMGLWRIGPGQEERFRHKVAILIERGAKFHPDETPNVQRLIDDAMQRKDTVFADLLRKAVTSPTAGPSQTVN